jgi:hypothetical protein
MELVIKLDNNRKPIGNPILLSNLKKTIPDFDINVLPVDYARFNRVEKPVIGVYEKNLRSEFIMRPDGVVHEVWYKDQMTSEEIQEKQNQAKAFWAEHGFASWTFDEETCSFIPPVPLPESKKFRVWDEETTSWVLQETLDNYPASFNDSVPIKRYFGIIAAEQNNGSADS